MALFYVSIGERDHALALMAKIEGNDEALEQSQSAGYSSPNKEPEDEQEAGKVDEAAPDPNDAVDANNMEVMMQEEFEDKRVD